MIMINVQHAATAHYMTSIFYLSVHYKDIKLSHYYTVPSIH